MIAVDVVVDPIPDPHVEMVTGMNRRQPTGPDESAAGIRPVAHHAANGDAGLEQRCRELDFDVPLV